MSISSVNKVETPGSLNSTHFNKDKEKSKLSKLITGLAITCLLVSPAHALTEAFVRQRFKQISHIQCQEITPLQNCFYINKGAISLQCARMAPNALFETPYFWYKTSPTTEEEMLLCQQGDRYIGRFNETGFFSEGTITNQIDANTARMKAKGKFNSGKLEGPGIEYWPNKSVFYRGVAHHPHPYGVPGGKKAEGIFEAGELKQGVKYWPSGQKDSEGSYKDGELDGLGTEYKLDGTVNFQGQFKNGEPQPKGYGEYIAEAIDVLWSSWREQIGKILG